MSCSPTKLEIVLGYCSSVKSENENSCISFFRYVVFPIVDEINLNHIFYENMLFVLLTFVL